MPSCRPLTVYADDTDLPTLGTAELLIVAAVRLWAADPGERADGPRWRGAFTAARMTPAGAAGFVGLMRILAAAARRDLDIRRASCRLLGHDESLILRLVSLQQHGYTAPAAAILYGWLPAAAVRPAALPALAFATALADAGLLVPLRHAEAGDLDRLSAYAHAMPGLALVQ